ncbi:SgcJ/EcaC family oxidoreductase [Paenibacillus sp. HJGM_3]|uniref:SgcJ/EcaC family oxidoreductase n=1 Tax=Paenibacillus sp. HJGM_3 TaxID=3379816 RepID=UPI00385CB281
MEREIRELYEALLTGWNERNAGRMAELFAEEGEMIGFDGSQVTGSAGIVDHLQPIFAHHPTAAFVAIVRSVRALGPDAVLLRAIAGMVPPGKDDLNPAVNTLHSLVAVKEEGTWRIALFQNTPAQFHGRPELVQAMTDELREWLRSREDDSRASR